MKALRTITLLAVAVCAIALSVTPAFAQYYGSYRDTGGGIVSNQRWGFELTQMGGNLGFAPLTLKVTPAQTAVTTITTAQTLDTYPIPAGLMNSVGRILRVCFSGVYTSPGTTAPTLTFALKIGSSVTPITITSAAVSTTASTNMPFSGCYNVVTAAIGATGTDEAHGDLKVNVTANTPAAAAAVYLDTNTAVSSTYDHTAANTATLSIAASLTVTSAQLRMATWDLLN